MKKKKWVWKTQENLGQEDSRQRDNQVQEPLARCVFLVSRERKKSGGTGTKWASGRGSSGRGSGRIAKVTSCRATARTSGFILCLLWSHWRIRVGSLYKSLIPAVFIGDHVCHTVSTYPSLGVGSAPRQYFALPQTSARTLISYLMSALPYLENLPALPHDQSLAYVQAKIFIPLCWAGSDGSPALWGEQA